MKSAIFSSTAALAIMVACLPAITTADSNEPARLSQNLGRGDKMEITDAEAAIPWRVLVQSTPRRRSYPDDLMNVGFHVRTGRTVTMPTDIRMADLNTSHVIGAHGKETVVRYTGRWQADGGNAFPHLVLTEGARFVFTAESSMDLVMSGSFFTRQLWVYGDGTGVIELEEGFVADRTVNEPLPDAMGTIRLGGATLITHHTRNMPANTRPDGRGGHYQNGHVVFERIPGNRWIVKTSNQVYAAQVDFDTDGVIETQAALTHNGHRRVVLPVGPGGHFISSGAFRTTSPNVTITKTGPAMLALEGEQSYHPGSRLIVEEGLLRMTTDPGLGRDNDARGNAGPFLQLQVTNEGRLHLTAPRHHLQRLEAADRSRVWIDRGTEVIATEGTQIGRNGRLDLNGSISGGLQIAGTLAIEPGHGQAIVQSISLTGAMISAFGHTAGEAATLTAHGKAELGGELRISFHDRRGRVPEEILLVEAGELKLDPSWTGSQTCANDRFAFNLVQEGNRLLVRNIRPIGEDSTSSLQPLVRP